MSPDPCRPARRDRVRDRVLLAARSAAVRRAAAGVRCGRLRFRPFSPALRSVRECGYLPYSAGAPAGAARAQLHLSQLAATSYFELVSCVCIKTSVIFPHSRFARPGYYVHARPGGAPPGPAAQPYRPAAHTPHAHPLRSLHAHAHAPRTHDTATTRTRGIERSRATTSGGRACAGVVDSSWRPRSRRTAAAGSRRERGAAGRPGHPAPRSPGSRHEGSSLIVRERAGKRENLSPLMNRERSTTLLSVGSFARDARSRHTAQWSE